MKRYNEIVSKRKLLEPVLLLQGILLNAKLPSTRTEVFHTGKNKLSTQVQRTS